MLTTPEVSKRYGFTERTWIAWRREKKGPPWYRVGGKLIVYDRREVEAYLAQKQESDGVTRWLVSGCLDCQFRLVEVGGDNRDLCFVADRRALPSKRRPPRWCPLPLFVGCRKKVEGEGDAGTTTQSRPTK